MKESIDLEYVKWLLGLAVGGYAPIAGLVWYLLRELIKSKDEENDSLKDVLPMSNKLADLSKSMLHALDALKNNKSE